MRAGANSVTIAGDNPPVRIIEADDIVYVDLGPVFEAWEADIGKSYVLGSDPRKHSAGGRSAAPVRTGAGALPRAIPTSPARRFTPSRRTAAAAAGWRFGGKIAGHIVSEFAHALIPGDKALNRIGPLNPEPDERSRRQGPRRGTGFWKSIWWRRTAASAAFTRGCCDLDLHRRRSGARGFAGC